MNHEFSQAMQRFIQSIRLRHPTSSTATHYQSDLEQFRKVIDQAPRKITRADITRFITLQLTAGLSASTVNRRLATLSSFFEFLADEAGDDHWPNPVVWRTHRIAEGSHLPRDLPETIARQFWQAVCLGIVRDQALIALMLDVGLRVGEVAALRVQDLEAASSRDGLSALRVRGKGDKERRVWLVPETAALIRQWLAERPAVVDDALFITRRRCGFSIRGIQDRVKHYTKKAGLALDQVSCHRLRHTFARRMAESRMPLPSLCHWLGHSQLTTTQIYIDGANPDIRIDYRAAMSSLLEATAAKGPKSPVPVVAREESALEAIHAPRPPLSTSEVAGRISTLPSWVRTRLEGFIQARQARWSAHHRRARALQWLGELRRGWSWFLDEYRMNGFADLSRVHLHAYLTYLQDQELSAHTVNHFLTTFWSFLSFVEEQGEQIAPGLYRVPRPQKPDWQPRPLAEDEYLRLERIILTTAALDAQVGALHQSWFLLLSDGGLRISELETLTLGDWDPASQTLHIRHGKGKRERRIPVTSRLAQALQAYLTSRPMARHQEPLLLYQGRAIPAHYIRKRLRAFAAQAKVENVTPHRLRHTYATRLLNTGRMPVTTLQKLMGHRYLDTTMRYAELYDRTIRRDYEAAMATVQSHSEPEFDWTLWGPTIEEAFHIEGDAVDVQRATTVANCM
jgi:site-specific recombinase XerD